MNGQMDPKREALVQSGTLNPKAAQVTDALFRDHEFFDSCDLIQVKYEMLRRVLLESMTVTRAAELFSFSRTAFYQALASFREGGLPGLIPERPGPRGAHKLTEDVVDFIQDCLARNASLRAVELAELVQGQFGRSVHPRSVERALGRRKKGG